MEDSRLERYFELIHGAILDLRADMDARFDAMQAQMDARFDAVDARFAAVDARFDAMSIEWNERFQGVLDRLDLLERRTDKVVAIVEELRTDVASLKNEIYKLDAGLDRLQKSVNGLGDDMRQRFRGVNERLSAVEKRLAAA